MKQKRIEILKAEEQLLKQEITSKNKKLEEVRKKIDRLTPKEIEISDHALIRFLERKMNLDVLSIKNHFLTEDITKQILELGGKGRFLSDDLTLVIENYKIVTIY